MTNSVRAEIVRDYATENGLRLGQALFNLLPVWVQNRIRSTHIDPFYASFRPHDVDNWIDNHLIFSDPKIGPQQIIAVYNGNQILAEVAYGTSTVLTP